MKITIDINDLYIEVLSKWASISRTLDAAQRCCDQLSDLLNGEELSEEDKSRFIEQANWTSKEISIVRPAMHHLHSITQSTIWEEDRKQKENSNLTR